MSIPIKNLKMKIKKQWKYLHYNNSSNYNVNNDNVKIALIITIMISDRYYSCIEIDILHVRQAGYWEMNSCVCLWLQYAYIFLSYIIGSIVNNSW